jgi:hypothetical protein
VEFIDSTKQNAGRQERFAVNVDPRESDLSQLQSAMLPAQLQPHTELEFGQPLLPPPTGFTLFRYFLVGVAVLLVLEGGLAGWFGRRAV